MILREAAYNITRKNKTPYLYTHNPVSPLSESFMTTQAGVISFPVPAGRETGSFKGTVVQGNKQRYSIDSLIGTGGLCEVYCAGAQDNGKIPMRYAAKFLLPQMERNAEKVMELIQEARVLAYLNHPNIVAFADASPKNQGNVFLVMEYLEGKTLEKVLRETPCIPLDMIAHIILQIANALCHMHEESYVHRDVSPKNIILINYEGDPYFVKVIDFGLARSSEEPDDDPEDDTSEMISGTPSYMAPEQICGDKGGYRADMYALATILFRMITGKLPFDTSLSVPDLLRAKIRSNPPSPHEVNPTISISKILEEFIMRVLNLDPADRPKNMEEFTQEFMYGVATTYVL